MSTLDCAEFIDLAPELALGNLCGDERAAAIAHLERCTACQQAMNSLTTVADRLLLLAPRVEPPAGFEQRLLAALPVEPPRRRHLRHTRRRWATFAATAALLITLIAGGLLVDLGSPGQPAFAAAEMRTASGELVGEIFLRHDAPASLFMTLPGWAEQIERHGQAADYYAVRIETSNGQVTTRPVTLNADASWATTLDLEADAVTTVALVDGDGDVWCQARFES
jgi:hypothetical protein